MEIKSQYKIKGHRLEEAIDSILEKNPRLRCEYEKPPASSDRLFKPDVVHNSRECSGYCASNPLNMIRRRERTEYEDNPAIYYGLIASANQLMKDALIRDGLAAEKDVYS